MEQKEALESSERVQRLRDEAEGVREYLRDLFGNEDTRALRAGEVCDALQRLRWDLERKYEQNIAASA
jgi:hypothetical protein